MNFDDLTELRPGAQGCPSDLQLDELLAGELTPALRKQLQAHLSSCSPCAERLQAFREGFDAFPEAAPAAIQATLEVAADQARRVDAAQGQTATSPWHHKLLGWLHARGPLLAPLAVGAAAAVVLVAHPGRLGERDTEVTGGVRAKGSLALHVHRMRAGRSEEMLSGASFQPGDRLRFVVDLPWPGFVSVVGVETNGTLYVAWPLDPDTGPTLRPEGNSLALPGAVALDASPGPEVLHLVLCPEQAGAPACVTQGPQAPPTCQPGCSSTPFVLRKGLN